MEELLQAAVDQYNTQDKYQVELIHEDSREFDVLTAVITDTSKEEAKEPAVGSIPEIKGGVEAAFNEALTDVEPAGERIWRL